MNGIEEKEILNKIIEKFNLYKGQKINYEELVMMYDSYSDEFTMIRFANLLGIKDKAFYNFKEKHERNKEKNVTTRILLNIELTEKEKNLKILELVRNYNLYKGKKIDYSFFMQMYNQVNTKLTELEFADMLGIKGANLRNIRNSKQEVALFKNISLNSEKVEQIRKGLIKIYEGKSIYYKETRTHEGEIEFWKLYSPYRLYFTQKKFAEMLGISEKNLWYAKNEKGNPKIKDTEKVAKVEMLKEKLEKGRYYSKEELEKICKNIELSIDDFIIYYINHGDYFDTSVYRQAIESNEKIWLGKGKIPNDYIEKNIGMLQRVINTVVGEINKRYSEKYLEEDLKSDIMLYIISDCIDIIKNFSYNTKIMERMLWIRSRKYAQIVFIHEYKKDIKKIGLNEGKTKNNGSER